MELSLIAQDAASVEADLQFVKHFDGLVGGSEAAINQELGGALAPVFEELERSTPPSGRIVRSDVDTIRSRHLLVLGLGPLDDFGIEDLNRAIDYATRSALRHRYAVIATPAIGSSLRVGLPLDKAYEMLLSAFFRVIGSHRLESESCPVDELRVFDLSERKVALMARMTGDVLTELGMHFRVHSGRRFEIQI